MAHAAPREHQLDLVTFATQYFDDHAENRRARFCNEWQQVILALIRSHSRNRVVAALEDFGRTQDHLKEDLTVAAARRVVEAKVDEDGRTMRQERYAILLRGLVDFLDGPTSK